MIKNQGGRAAMAVERITDCIDIVDERFRYFIPPNTWLERLATGFLWSEGPVWFADTGVLVWSDIPNDRMMRWTEAGVSEFRRPSNFTNGNTRDREGRLVSCEHGSRRVTRTEADGTITVLAEKFGGKRLNSPNDVVVKSDGSIWFTDPPYGILSDYEGHRAESEIGACNVYRIDPADGGLTVVAGDFDKPNGLCFSPDEKRLYISDTGRSHDADGAHHIRVFDVAADGRSLSNARVFAEIEPGVSDGFRADTDGNIWTSAGDGVQVFDPDGHMVGRILVPETVANVTFGGARRNRLFITATTSVYAIYVGKTGAQRP